MKTSPRAITMSFGSDNTISRVIWHLTWGQDELIFQGHYKTLDPESQRKLYQF
jgi:hypothetical protein